MRDRCPFPMYLAVLNNNAICLCPPLSLSFSVWVLLFLTHTCKSLTLICAATSDPAPSSRDTHSLSPLRAASMKRSSHQADLPDGCITTDLNGIFEGVSVSWKGALHIPRCGLCVRGNVTRWFRIEWGGQRCTAAECGVG